MPESASATPLTLQQREPISTEEGARPSQPLRYAVILDSESIADWQVDVLDNLEASGNSEPVAFILPVRAEKPPRFSLGEFFRHFLYFLARLTVWRPKFFRHRPLPERWAGLDRVKVGVERKGKFTDVIAAEDLERISGLDLDFILKFGLRILRGDALKAARYGVWSFHHGDEREVRGRPAGFWEVYHGRPTTGVILQRLTNKLDGGVILKRGVMGTVLHSYMKSLGRIYRGSADFPALVCADIQRGCAGYLEAPPSSTHAPIFKNPTNLQVLVCFARIAYAALARVLYGAFRLKVWAIGINKQSVGTVLYADKPPLRWLASKNKRVFVADPFLVAGTKGRTWLFYEHLNYWTLKGRIGCVEVNSGEADVDAHAALVDGHHLSFPCVFQHEGTIYCVPEEADNGRVRLFRFDEETRRLEEVATLLKDIKAVDPAVFFHGGWWWIALTDEAQGMERMMLWHSRDLKGPYVPHAGNPVKIDSRHARAAGRPFTWEGKVYRPTQDQSQGYGRLVTVQEIVKLDPTTFEERTVTKLFPFDVVYSKGLHQLACTSEWTAVDGYREIFHPFAWFYRLKGWLSGAGSVGVPAVIHAEVAEFEPVVSMLVAVV